MYFTSRVIDCAPDLLQRSYDLRYQVYCLERNFLSESDYPNHYEVDEFDPYSIHIGSINRDGDLVGTTRLVLPGEAGLPMYKVCDIFPQVRERLDSIKNLAEISRLCVSRQVRRRVNDGYFGELLPSKSTLPPEIVTDRRHPPYLVVSIYKQIYQTCKRRGITHLLSATEKSLQRLLFRYRFPFHAIGPEVDYFGPVVPYLLDLEELDHRLMLHHSPLMDEFVDGLEREFWPAEYRPRTLDD